MASRRLDSKQWAAILAAHVTVVALVWRDLRHRGDDEVRGSKKFWRVTTSLNSANSLAYLAIGRRRRVGASRAELTD